LKVIAILLFSTYIQLHPYVHYNLQSASVIQTLRLTYYRKKTVCVVVRFTGQTLSNRYGPGTGPIWLDDVQCSGSETFIGDCHHYGWGSHDCDHDEDVSIRCTYISVTTTTEPPTQGKCGTTRLPFT